MYTPFLHILNHPEISVLTKVIPIILQFFANIAAD